VVFLVGGGAGEALSVNAFPRNQKH